MSTRIALIFWGWLLGHAPAQITQTEQTISVRLFEILHPQALELRLELQTLSVANFLSNGYHAGTPIVGPSRLQAGPGATEMASPPADEWRTVFQVQIVGDTLWRTAKPIRIWRQGRTLQFQSEDDERTLSLTDTVIVAANSAPILASVKSRQGKEKIPGRPYAGAFKIYITRNELVVVNLTPIDDYLAGVLAAELKHAPFAALQAQAVAARTYLIRNWQRHAQKGYHACDLTHCQRFAGIAGVDSSIQQAIASTADEILTYKNQPIEIFYSSTCGGRTANDLEVWSSRMDHPYLISVSDSSRKAGYCAASPHFRWHLRLHADSLLQLWRRELGDAIVAIGVSKKSADGRVRELALMGQSLHLVSGENFRAVVCRLLGWNSVKSTAFDLQLEKNEYVFTGRGLGHGVGLCQFGAMGMARAGHSYQKILKHYFPKAEIRKYEYEISGIDGDNE